MSPIDLNNQRARDVNTPMEARIANLRVSYTGDPVAEEVLVVAQDKIEVYRHNSEYYGYTFFVARPATSSVKKLSGSG
jgi:hypothetical protein